MADVGPNMALLILGIIALALIPFLIIFFPGPFDEIISGIIGVAAISASGIGRR